MGRCKTIPASMILEKRRISSGWRRRRGPDGLSANDNRRPVPHRASDPSSDPLKTTGEPIGKTKMILDHFAERYEASGATSLMIAARSMYLGGMAEMSE
jgi:hypothetical protein